MFSIDYSKYSIHRETNTFKVSYYVKDNFHTEYQGSLGRLEASVEEEHINNLKHLCYRERNYSELIHIPNQINDKSVTSSRPIRRGINAAASQKFRRSWSPSEGTNHNHSGMWEPPENAKSVASFHLNNSITRKWVIWCLFWLLLNIFNVQTSGELHIVYTELSVSPILFI